MMYTVHYTWSPYFILIKPRDKYFCIILMEIILTLLHVQCSALCEIRLQLEHELNVTNRNE